MKMRNIQKLKKFKKIFKYRNNRTTISFMIALKQNNKCFQAVIHNKKLIQMLKQVLNLKPMKELQKMSYFQINKGQLLAHMIDKLKFGTQLKKNQSQHLRAMKVESCKSNTLKNINSQVVQERISQPCFGRILLISQVKNLVAIRIVLCQQNLQMIETLLLLEDQISKQKFGVFLAGNNFSKSITVQILFNKQNMMPQMSFSLQEAIKIQLSIFLKS
ncbi:hypothetical protein ABPG72_000138 [Tetrahymena utriculariae]